MSSQGCSAYPMLYFPNVILVRDPHLVGSGLSREKLGRSLIEQKKRWRGVQRIKAEAWKRAHWCLKQAQDLGARTSKV